MKLAEKRKDKTNKNANPKSEKLSPTEGERG